MAWLVRFRRRALRRLEASVAEYGTDFRDAVAAWLDALAADCESGNNHRSLDAETFLKQWAVDAPPSRRGPPPDLSVRERIERILA